MGRVRLSRRMMGVLTTRSAASSCEREKTSEILRATRRLSSSFRSGLRTIHQFCSSPCVFLLPNNMDMDRSNRKIMSACFEGRRVWDYLETDAMGGLVDHR